MREPADGAVLMSSGSVPTTHLVELDYSPSGDIGEPGDSGIPGSFDAAILRIEVGMTSEVAI